MITPDRRTNSAALAFLAAGTVWLMVGTLYGLVSAIDLLAPEFFSNIPWLVFGRSRPVHVNTLIYGFVINMLVGSGLYYLPALLKCRLWSETMAWWSFFLWNLAVLSGPVSFAYGHTQGREYSEYIFSADLAIVAAVLLLAINSVMTIVHRRENFLYVAVWYFVATFLWTIFAYPIGNVMWHPASGALSGMLDSVILWFYAHNLPGLILTPLATGAAYYVIPRVARTPLYSHTLSVIGFWTLVAFYTHIGGHHLIQAPIPSWMRNIAVVHSIVMVVPVFTVLANLWLTVRGVGGRVLADPAGRFVLAGSIWYLITCIQGPAQSLPELQRVTHLNNWTIGHSHIAVLGFAGFIALGAMWHVLPLIVRRRIYAPRLVNMQFGLLMTGLTGFFVVLTAAGLIEGQGWYNGETVYRTLAEMPTYMGLRAALGLAIITAAGVGLFNFWMTVWRGEPFAPQYVIEAEEEP